MPHSNQKEKYQLWYSSQTHLQSMKEAGQGDVDRARESPEPEDSSGGPCLPLQWHTVLPPQPEGQSERAPVRQLSRAVHLATGSPCCSPACSCLVYSTTGNNLGKRKGQDLCFCCYDDGHRTRCSQNTYLHTQHIATVESKNFPYSNSHIHQ